MDTLIQTIELLGEDNVINLKKKITDMIVGAIRRELEQYTSESYILDIDEIQDFINDCKEKAFDNLKEDIIATMEKRIKESLKND